MFKGTPQRSMWRLERAWGRGSARWLVWVLFMLFALAGLLLGAWSLQRAQVERNLVEQQLQQLSLAVAPVAAQPTRDTDFVQALGSPAPAATIVQDLQSASSQAGIVLSSVQAQDRGASADHLGRLELLVTLRGSYVGAKQVLKQVVERFPGMTVQRLRMRRAQSPADIETSATLLLWSAPIMSAAVNDARGPTAAR